MRSDGELFSCVQPGLDVGASLIKAIGCICITDMHQFRGQPFIPLHQGQKIQEYFVIPYERCPEP